jgi:NAD(P)-dependent dehydrogenase (short-subunit alcohol dehydrogenase family)
MNTREMLDLTGKVALITGGSRGLGLYMAHGLAEMGATVAITARSPENLRDAQAELERAGAKVLTVSHDLADVDASDALVDQVVGELGDIDILVNNAAIAIPSPAAEHPAETWNSVVDVNLNALFFLTQAVARRCMIPRRYGKILNISSTGGLGGNAIDSPLIISYNATKGAVIALTRALATEWGRYNINVNAIAPGTFPSQMTAATLPPGHLKRVLAKTPLNRVGAEDDIKGVAAFFVSEAAKHLSGQFVVLDGGAFTTNYTIADEEPAET